MSEKVERHEWRNSDGDLAVVARDLEYSDAIWSHQPVHELNREILNLATQLAEARRGADSTDTPVRRVYACGCVSCVCMDDERCHGCGARGCGQPGMPNEHSPGGRVETLPELFRRAEAAERKLAEAEEVIRLANEQVDVKPTFEDERVSYVEVQMDRGFRAEWLALPAVRRALGKEGK